MSVSWISPHRGTPLWARWLIPVLLFTVVGCLIGSWLWMQRPVQFQEPDVYGTWVSDGPHPTILQFKEGGVVAVSQTPLRDTFNYRFGATSDDAEWKYFQLADSREVDVGLTPLYAENGWFATVLALYTGDPDQPANRVVFRRTSGPGQQQ